MSTLLCRLIGFYVIYFIILHHFKIDFSFIQNVLMGIGIGLLMIK